VSEDTSWRLGSPFQGTCISRILQEVRKGLRWVLGNCFSSRGVANPKAGARSVHDTFGTINK
jgi:hypothetical protein